MENTGFAKYGWFILCVISCLAFLVLLGRVAYIQSVKVVDKQNLNVLGEDIWTKHENLKADRGKILDRNGLEIARDITSYTIYAVLDEGYPDHVKDPLDASRKLSPILGISENDLFDKLSKKGYFQVEFGSKGKNLKPSIKNEIEALDLGGIRFRPESTRFYPNGVFASHAIGYSQFSEEEEREVGRMGIEATYDEYLTGKDGSISYHTDRKGYKLPDPKEQVYLPKDGHDVYLTIDQKIQTFLEEAVSYVYEEYEPEKITAIVADPKTGEILGMTNAPSFDPNVRDITNYQNDAIKYAFEPGSTMKIYTLAAAINEGVWNPNAWYQSGTYKISPNSKAIRDHNNGKGWGSITYLEGFQRSSNVLVSKIVNEQLGTEKFKEYLHAFDFDEKTGVDLPGEEVGTILYKWPIEKITTSFGQGTTITPIQQIKAMTAIANNGNMMQPYIVKKVVDQKGEVVQENTPTVVGNPVTPETAKEVLEVMETVVHEKNGTGKMYKLDGYRVAGKTGTSQIPDPETGGYLWGYGNNIFSFMGAVPAENPEFIMYVSVQQPKLELKEWGYETGADTVSYIFRKVMANSLFYKKVEQTEVVEIENKIQIGNFVGGSAKEAEKELEENADVYVLGDGSTVVAQYPKQGSAIKGTKVLLVTDGEAVLPDITGWSLRDVLRLAALLEIDISHYGSGFVSKQSLPEGTVLEKGKELLVELSRTLQGDVSDNPEYVEALKEIESRNEEKVGVLETIEPVGEGLGVVGP